MISSEILQIGPETILPHPDAPDLLCFQVTNAGDRRVKTLARKRWIPIRHELIDLGLPALIARARAEERRFLWPAMRQHDDNITRVSGYFSSFWASFTRDELGIQAEGTSLYSFRHAFQDRLSAAGRSDEAKKALMGHTAGGMTGRYGTKKRPRVVNIAEINDALQSLDWPFLAQVRPST
jgi:integrase